MAAGEGEATGQPVSIAVAALRRGDGHWGNRRRHGQEPDACQSAAVPRAADAGGGTQTRFAAANTGRERSKCMKSWLTKFRISNALDAGKPLPERLRRRIAAEPELERFVDCAGAFGRSLRSGAVAVPSLH